MVSSYFLLRKLIGKLLFAFVLILSTSFPIQVFGDEPIVEAQDRERVELFLKHMLIEGTGIYTLMGSKPITAFLLAPIIDEREKKELYAIQTEQFRKYISFSKFRPTKEDARKLWRDWKKVQHKYIGSPFLIREDDQFDGIFINILSVTYILEKYSKEFEKVIQESIVPKTFVFRIGENGDSAWEKIKKNHFLMGLLFGYGEKNSRCFTWENNEKRFYSLRRGTSFSSVGTGKPIHELTIHDLDVPGFVSYQMIDEQVEQYRLERKKCIEFFEGKDFCELAVSILKGQPPPSPQKELSKEARRLIREQAGYNGR